MDERVKEKPWDLGGCCHSLKRASWKPLDPLIHSSRGEEGGPWRASPLFQTTIVADLSAPDLTEH